MARLELPRCLRRDVDWVSVIEPDNRARYAVGTNDRSSGPSKPESTPGAGGRSKLAPSDQLEDLVRRYSRLVRSAIRRVGGAQVDGLAEDVEQRVFLGIWKQVSREQQIDHPASYIYRVAVRETVRLLKQERRHRSPDDLVQDANATAIDLGAGPEMHLRARETVEQIDRILETLAPARRRAVRAHLVGLEVREIMKLEGWSYNRARNLVARGMADLRRGLQEQALDG